MSENQKRPTLAEDVLGTSERLRWEIGSDFHEHLMESIYTDAARIAEPMVQLAAMRGSERRLPPWPRPMDSQRSDGSPADSAERS